VTTEQTLTVQGGDGGVFDFTSVTTTQKVNDGGAGTVTYFADGGTGSPRIESTTPMGRKSVTELYGTAANTVGRGRVKSQKPANDNVAAVEYTYDAQGRVMTVQQGNCAVGASAEGCRRVSFTYLAGQLKTATDALGRVVTYNYDLAGRVTSTVLPGGRTITVVPDANGNAKSVTTPKNDEHKFEFTPSDQTSSYTPPVVGNLDMTTWFSYNLDGQAVRETRPEGAALVSTYSEPSGWLNNISFGSGTITPVYDSGVPGRVTGLTRTGAAGVSLAFGYKGALPRSVTWQLPASKSAKLVFEHDGQLRTGATNVLGHGVVETDATNRVAITYDGRQLGEFGWGNGHRAPSPSAECDAASRRRPHQQDDSGQLDEQLYIQLARRSRLGRGEAGPESKGSIQVQV